MVHIALIETHISHRNRYFSWSIYILGAVVFGFSTHASNERQTSAWVGRVKGVAARAPGMCESRVRVNTGFCSSWRECEWNSLAYHHLLYCGCFSSCHVLWFGVLRQALRDRVVVWEDTEEKECLDCVCRFGSVDCDRQDELDRNSSVSVFVDYLYTISNLMKFLLFQESSCISVCERVDNDCCVPIAWHKFWACVSVRCYRCVCLFPPAPSPCVAIRLCSYRLLAAYTLLTLTLWPFHLFLTSHLFLSWYTGASAIAVSASCCPLFAFFNSSPPIILHSIQVAGRHSLSLACLMRSFSEKSSPPSAWAPFSIVILPMLPWYRYPPA